MNIRRALVILLLFLLPLQATLAAADGCCLGAKVLQAGEQGASLPDLPGSDGGCCTQCDFCHHFHAPFVAAPAGAPQYAESIAPVQAPEPPIHSFIPDIPPRPDRLR
ncbi:hypothetical protein GM658_26875 [Pseudoduganella eburnea]|uniref:DUF2946 domain-containing protein n=1 Tax=Massilia eburnea TaxID=1776165 RepID=A0A6L6QQ94_9BURK|nr:hypothetical protein [Massilia eburnea]MTW14244.1 hypothetical protein [Massilia eburnea]